MFKSVGFINKRQISTITKNTKMHERQEKQIVLAFMIAFLCLGKYWTNLSKKTFLLLLTCCSGFSIEIVLQFWNKVYTAYPWKLNFKFAVSILFTNLSENLHVNDISHLLCTKIIFRLFKITTYIQYFCGIYLTA